MIVLDTTILVYAAGGDHSLRAPCRRIFEAVAAGRVHAQTTTFVIQEFLHVASRRRDRGDAAALAGHFAAVLAPLLPHDDAHVDDSLSLYERYPSLGAFDAFLAATARAAGATLVSADTAFAEVRELRHVDPATPELDALLAG